MRNLFWIAGVIMLVLVVAGGGIAAENIFNEKDESKYSQEVNENLLTGEGILVGRIDNHSVEIQAGDEFNAFGLSDEITAKEFIDGSRVKFEYYMDTNGRAVITKIEIEEQDKEFVVNKAGVFVGLADSHTVEIKVEDKANTFALGKGISTDSLEMGDEVIFDYKENWNRRDEIIRLEKKPGKKVKLQSAEGIITGRIDSHSIEIKVNGEYKAFGLSEELRDKDFTCGEINFKYYVDSNGRMIITEADFQERTLGEVKTAEGTFSGLADGHTAEIIIDGKPISFGLEQYISFIGIDEGDDIFIAYQEDASGRLVIIKIEKII